MDPGAAATPSLGLSPQRRPPPPTTTQPWSQLWLPGWCSSLMLMELLDVYTLEVTGYLLSGVPGKLFQGRGLTGSPVLWHCLRWVLGGQSGARAAGRGCSHGRASEARGFGTKPLAASQRPLLSLTPRQLTKDKCFKSPTWFSRSSQ